MRVKIILQALFISFMIVHPVFSQVGEEKEDTDKVYKFKEIIVKEKKEQPGTTTILTDKEVKDSTKTDLIGVINENVPSFYTGSRGIMGYGVSRSGSSRMTIRGMGLSSWGPTTGFPIFFNGIDTTATVWSHPVADIFSMKNIERIEVFHGPQPVLFGSSAMAGAINVVTQRQEKEGFNTFLSASYGSYNTTDDYIHHMGKIGVFDYGFSYNYQYTDGHRKEEIGGQEFTSQFRSHNGTARIGLELGKDLYASLTGYIMDMNIHDPGPDNKGSAPETLEIFDILRGGSSLSIRNSYKILEGYLQVYSNYGIHEGTNPVTCEKWYRHVDRTDGVKLQETLKKIISGNSITAGAEVKRYGGEIEKSSSATMDEEYLTDSSLYGLVEQSLFQLITVSVGARYTDNSEYGGYTAYQGGLIINPTRSTKIFANAAKGFTIPGIRYRYNPNYPGVIIDENSDLEPEINIVYEGGIEQTFLESIVIGLTGYAVRSKNKIIPVFAPPPPRFVNSDDDIEYTGLEASARYDYRDMAGVRASYSYIDNEYEDKAGDKQILSYVPRHKAVFGAFVELYHVYVGLNGEYVKTIWHDYINNQKLDDYLLLNAKIAYTFLERFQLFINLNNITNVKYATYIRDGGEYTMPGFNVLGGASAMF
jgi:outer membrane receptor protein involved in Fe transport